jgi:hypothetical protein
MVLDPTQELARRVSVVHNLVYYCPEIRRFADAGIPGWWNAYFAYRSAPMGPVPASVVVATFYNFAPAMVGRAIPAAWAALTPTQALDLRTSAVEEALRRVFPNPDALAAAALLARPAIDGVDGVARPLYAATAALDWPAEPHLALWHACTLLREHRGDSHNLALAAAEVDGVECHVLMAGRGHGNKTSILPIRGWTSDEWDAAVQRLAGRGWVGPDGALTRAGREARAAIETHTNRLAAAPVRRLGDGLDTLLVQLDPLVAALHERGGVPGVWPPPHLQRDGAGPEPLAD